MIGMHLPDEWVALVPRRQALGQREPVRGLPQAGREESRLIGHQEGEADADLEAERIQPGIDQDRALASASLARPRAAAKPSTRAMLLIARLMISFASVTSRSNHSVTAPISAGCGLRG